MPTQKNNSSTASSRGWVVAGALALLIALVMTVWNAVSKKEDGRNSSENVTPGVGQTSGTGGLQPHAGEAGHRAGNSTRSSRKRPTSPGGDDDARAPQFPHVQQILSDAALSEHQAAQSLLGIVARTELDEPERYEALAHGLNLDPKVFVELTKDPQLPARFAQRCFDELVVNQKLSKEQIETCLNLMGHSDEEIRKQVTSQLAFLFANEALGSSPDELRRVALEKLENLRAAPPVPEETGDHGGVDDVGAGTQDSQK